MRIIRKLFYTTLTTFLILTVYTLSNINNNVLRTNLELDDITNLKTNTVYLLNMDNYFTKVDIYLESKDINDEINNIYNYLKVSNKKILSNYHGYIPDKSMIIDKRIDNNILYLTLSEDLLNEELSIEALAKSLLCLISIDKVSINISDKYNEIFDDNLSLNKEYNITNRKDIEKVVIYYFNNDNNYIPVTKYLNDKRDKIEIIIDELKNNDQSNLISYLNSNVKLLDYNEENNILFLNFNKYLSDDKNKLDYNLNEIALSIFDNYDISSVMFKENGKNIKLINK